MRKNDALCFLFEPYDAIPRVLHRLWRGLEPLSLDSSTPGHSQSSARSAVCFTHEFGD